jgi:hypothetical protein
VNSESQINVPDSFLALFIAAPGRKPSQSREFIAQRYELCEDMAQMLVDTASAKVMDLGVDEEQVLQRMFDGLSPGPVLSAEESLWVVRRLAELLTWPLPPGLDWRHEGA